jgi:hypothetical protein
MLIDALFSDAAVERLEEGDVRGLARPAEIQGTLLK